MRADGLSAGGAAGDGGADVLQGVRGRNGGVGAGGPGNFVSGKACQGIEVGEEAGVDVGEVFCAVMVDEPGLGDDGGAAFSDEAEDFRRGFGAVFDAMPRVWAGMGAAGGGDGLGGGDYGFGFDGVEGELSS